MMKKKTRVNALNLKRKHDQQKKKACKMRIQIYMKLNSKITKC